MPERPFEHVVRVLADVGGQRGRASSDRQQLLHFTIGSAIVAAAIIGVLVGIYHAAVHLAQEPLADVSTYYLGGKRLNEGAPLYPSDADPDLVPYYRYPPLLAIAMRPFALLPYPVFAVLWEAGTILAFVLFVRRLGLNRRTLLGIAILGKVIGDVLPIGQAHMHVTWLLALGQPWSVALAGQLKVFPALAALYWAGRAEWRKLGEFLAWTLGLLAVQVVLAPQAMLDFFETLTLSQVGEAVGISPYYWSKPLWLFLVVAFLFITPLVARTRFGWAAAVAYSSLVYPRLFWYHLLSLGAALKTPEDTEGSPRTKGQPAGSSGEGSSSPGRTTTRASS